MTVLGPILVLALAAVAAVAWIMGGAIALTGVGVGLFITLVPGWIPFQAVRRGEEHGVAVLKATAIRFLSALVVAGIAEFTQPKEMARTFLLGMAASYLVMLAVETIYFSRPQNGSGSAVSDGQIACPATPAPEDATADQSAPAAEASATVTSSS